MTEKLRIYLASGFNWRHNFRALAKNIEAKGYEISSSWIYLDDRPDRSQDDWDLFAGQIAKSNQQDLSNSDILVIDTRGKRESNHGGMDSEYGYMLAKHKYSLLVGPRTNTFHWLIPDKMCFDNEESLLEFLSERWVVVPEFPNYEVSNFGQVRRRTTIARTKAGTILGQKETRGYFSIGLYQNDKRIWSSVHSLVSLAFHGAPEFAKAQIDHLNNNPGDNHFLNLEWVTQLENQRRSWERGRVISEEQRRKTSQTLMGNQHLLGWNPSEDTRENMRQAALKRTRNEKGWFM